MAPRTVAILCLMASVVSGGNPGSIEMQILQDGSVQPDDMTGGAIRPGRRVHKRVRSRTETAGPIPGEVLPEDPDMHEISPHTAPANEGALLESHSSAAVASDSLLSVEAQMLLDARLAAFKKPKKKPDNSGAKGSSKEEPKQSIEKQPDFLPARIWAIYQRAIKYANTAFWILQMANTFGGLNIDMKLLRIAFMGYIHEDEDDYLYWPMNTGLIDWASIDSATNSNY
eukprot:CAMPEP_0206570962 /NCGR_PEP_ID=MMETSP0325_2-20121206/27349_1 /ASSEMBLY_ACC=CAM_ASM_000347 /TAXON_ID=2866 /ORGANISM="Crypthecodinium cohnii, Strain Seligo" /LENGTH=227 /DNA_ID=CAMNT_0054074849 /DNA_START=11 /DNA_END=694 /DNA_ORIENTATION=+